jgi:hypothetical protein
MAAELKPAAKPTSTQKHEAFVEEQLARARRRIRSLDLAAGTLVLLCSLALYVGLVGLLDRAWGLGAGVRTAALVLYAVAALGYAGWWGWRLVGLEVNPYFAARRLEATLPATKNSVLNWLDLRREKLPPAIRGSLGRRAAKDLTQADLERAVSPRQVLWLAGTFAVLLAALLIWLALSPGQFLSLVQRALVPFEMKPIDTTTHLELLHPKNGNLVLNREQDVTVRVKITGRVPGVNEERAPKLRYRYSATGVYAHRALERDTRAADEWMFTIKRDLLRTGLLYKLSAGDAETEEYRIDVIGPPAVVSWDGVYQPRPYLNLHDEPFQVPDARRNMLEPELKHYRGTRVQLIARTNRPWHQGSLLVQQGAKANGLPGEPVPGDPKARQFTFVLDRPGTFQLQFKASDGEENVDRKSYKIAVIEDKAPTVTVTQPVKSITIPVNGTLRVAGFAEDDIGVKSMQLQMQLVKGAAPGQLQAKAYRPDHPFQLVDKSYPKKIDYQDFVVLTELKNARGEPVQLAKGDELKCWLEARDNCDYPDATGNLGRSEPFVVTITDPENEKKAQEQRKQAQKEQQKHQQQQDQQQKDKNEQIQKDRDKKQEGNGGGDGKSDPNLDKKKDDVQKAAQDQQGKGEKDRQEGPGTSKGNEKKDGSEGTSKGDDQKSDMGEGSNDARGDGGQEKDKQGSAGAKDKGNGGMSNDAGHSKEGNPDDKMGGQDAGAPKQGADGGEAGKARGDGTNESGGDRAAAKKAMPQDGGASGIEKGPGGQSGDASQTRNDASQSAGGQQTAPRTNATREEVEKLKQELQDPQKRAEALKQLEKIHNEAENPQVSRDAEELLKKFGQSYQTVPGGARDEGDAKPDNQPNKGNGPGKVVDTPQSQPGGSAKPAPGKQDADGKAKSPPSDPQVAEASKVKDRHGAVGGFDRKEEGGGQTNMTGIKADPRAQIRAGNLTLEDWRQLLKTAQKKLNWTDAEVAQFLRDVQADLARRNPKTAPGDKLVGKGVGSGVRPSEIGSAPQQRADTEAINLNRPAEFLEAYRNYTINRPQPGGAKTPR